MVNGSLLSLLVSVVLLSGLISLSYLSINTGTFGSSDFIHSLLGGGNRPYILAFISILISKSQRLPIIS